MLSSSSSSRRRRGSSGSSGGSGSNFFKGRKRQRQAEAAAAASTSSAPSTTHNTNSTANNDAPSTSAGGTNGTASNASSASTSSKKERCPMRGLSVCFSGFDPDVKVKYSRMVKEMGGEYTGMLYPQGPKRTTHLVTSNAMGPKFQTAFNYPEMQIVRLEWVDACYERGELVEVRKYCYRSAMDEEEEEDDDDDTDLGVDERMQEEEKEEERVLGMIERLLAEDRVLGKTNSARPVTPLFSRCQFYLAGFDDDGTPAGKANASSDRATLKAQLSKLIRRERGTVLWEIGERITHIIVADGCSESLRNAAIHFALALPGPKVVSPRWVVASCQSRQMECPMEYQPIVAKSVTGAAGATAVRDQLQSQSQSQLMAKSASVVQVKVEEDDEQGQEQQDQVNMSQRKKARPVPSSSSSSKSQNAIFRGAIFAFVRPTPPEGAIDWNTAEVEQAVVAHGGIVLSPSIVSALRKQAASNASDRDSDFGLAASSLNRNNSQDGAPLTDRVCYVVSGGGYPQHQNSAFHPLVGEVMKARLCRVDLVTPLWVYTSIAEKRDFAAKNHPLLFQPQPYHLWRLPSDVKMKVSVSGFVGSQRAGIRLMLESIGAVYTDSMGHSNTHLITKAASGPKYAKALEWGLKIVRVDWLYHIIRYGYSGEGGNDSKAGCEHNFVVKKTAPGTNNGKVTTRPRSQEGPQNDKSSHRGTSQQPKSVSITTQESIAASCTTQCSMAIDGQDQAKEVDAQTDAKSQSSSAVAVDREEEKKEDPLEALVAEVTTMKKSDKDPKTDEAAPPPVPAKLKDEHQDKRNDKTMSPDAKDKKQADDIKSVREILRGLDAPMAPMQAELGPSNSHSSRLDLRRGRRRRIAPPPTENETKEAEKRSGSQRRSNGIGRGKINDEEVRIDDEETSTRKEEDSDTDVDSDTEDPSATFDMMPPPPKRSSEPQHDIEESQVVWYGDFTQS